MSNALIYCQSGGGKTCNSTLVKAPKRGKNLLICTDNSSIVLQNFDRPNLEIINVSTVKEFVDAYRNGYESQKYDNIILDFDGGVSEANIANRLLLFISNMK